MFLLCLLIHRRSLDQLKKKKRSNSHLKSLLQFCYWNQVFSWVAELMKPWASCEVMFSGCIFWCMRSDRSFSNVWTISWQVLSGLSGLGIIYQWPIMFCYNTILYQSLKFFLLIPQSILTDCLKITCFFIAFPAYQKFCAPLLCLPVEVPQVSIQACIHVQRCTTLLFSKKKNKIIKINIAISVLEL